MKGRVAVVAALVLATAFPALAGFRIEEVDPQFPADVITSWFQGGLARVDGALEGLALIVDLRSGEGWLVDRPARRFASGKISDLAVELRKFEEAQAAGKSAGRDADQRVPPESAARLDVQVKDLGPGERLLGYDTRRHQVLVDGELLEELWLAPKLEVAREIDLAAFAAAVQKMLGGEGAGVGQGYEETEAYRALRAGGYPLRQVLFFVGERSTVEVRSVAEQQIPASDLAVPQGFTKVGYTELLFGEGE